MLVVKPISAKDTINLRHRILWPDLPRDKMILLEDSKGLHYGAFWDSRLVGTGSFFFKGKSVQLSKLAVDETMRRQGIASALLSTAIEKLIQKRCETVWCNARVSAARFYERNGFQLSTEVFQKRCLDYVIATRPLTKG